jgi:Zn-dependent peptidase ImmA (M78 family)
MATIRVGMKRPSNLNHDMSLLSCPKDVINLSHTVHCFTDDILDLYKLVDILGIKLELKPFNDLCFRLVNNYTNWVLTVNSNKSIEYKSFSIAVGIAHYLLHRYQNNLFEHEILFKGSYYSNDEYDAIKFATFWLSER